ncbi:MAG TPA: trigger factor, partial [Cytophagaceae bacterium]|nr:trigger factor [Cytophagaceae bacterium]
MQVIEVSEIEYCKLNIHYEADAAQIDSKKNEVITHFKRAPVPGFRQGRATVDAIKIHYKNQIKESLKRALAEEAYHNTLFEKNIKPFGQPNFTSIFFVGNKFSCDFSLNKKPDFEIAEYKNIELPKQEVGYTILELAEKLLENVRKQCGITVPFVENDFVQMGDSVVINYDCFDGETKVESVCAVGDLLTVGASKLPGFDENLLGMKLNETRTFYIKAPEGGLPSLEGKEIKFVITIVNGSKNTPMPLGDELAKKI